MGSGSRQYRISLGATQGQAKGIQDHQLAMIPIMQKQAEMQLEMQEKVFEQELEQTKQMNLLAMQLQPEPILMPAEVTETKPIEKKYLVYAALAVLAFFLLRKK